MKESADDSWEKFLNPNTLRANLVAASLFITAYEILKDSIVDHLRSFFSDFGDSGPVGGESYEEKVLSLDPKRNPLRASIAWWKANGVFDDGDEKLISDLTKHRNEVAHELPRFLASAQHNVQLELLEKLSAIVAKADQWWILNVELAIQDEIDSSEVRSEEIVSGNMMFLQLLISAASEPDGEKFYQEFLRRKRNAEH